MILFSEHCRNLFNLAKNIVVTNRDGQLIPIDEAGRMVTNLLHDMNDKLKKVMVIGNGGSAAIAGHMHNDLSKAVGIRSLVFQDLSLLTAMANDLGYDAAYEGGLNLWAEKGDLLITISSSGESDNMILAVQAAQKRGCQIITLTGFKKENRLRQCGDINFYVPATDYGLVETLHSMLAHYFTDMAQVDLTEETG